MFNVTFNEYTLSMTEGLPTLYKVYCEHARLVDEIDLKGTEDTVYCMTVKKRSGWPFLVVAQRCSADQDAGFHPGMLLVEETHVLFIGAGERLLAYRLDSPERLWEDQTYCGFWNWERYGEFVIMSAELELAVWDIYGQKRWSTFVEPPWSYELDADLIHLEVMGQRVSFPLNRGQTHPRQ